MTITFIGHGYVGLVTASVFADLGNTVWVIGHTKEKIENFIGRKIADSIPDLHDPNLPNFVPNKGIIGSYKEVMDDDLINRINEEYDKCLYT